MKKSLASLSSKKEKKIYTLKARIKILLLCIVICFFPIATTGQPGNPPHHPPGHGLPGDQKPHDTPLDSGLGILTLMGLVLIAQKTFKERRHNKK